MSSSLNGIFSPCKSKVDDESWVQNPLAACVTHQLNLKKKKKKHHLKIFIMTAHAFGIWQQPINNMQKY